LTDKPKRPKDAHQLAHIARLGQLDIKTSINMTNFDGCPTSET